MNESEQQRRRAKQQLLAFNHAMLGLSYVTVLILTFALNTTTNSNDSSVCFVESTTWTIIGTILAALLFLCASPVLFNEKYEGFESLWALVSCQVALLVAFTVLFCRQACLFNLVASIFLCLTPSGNSFALMLLSNSLDMRRKYLVGFVFAISIAAFFTTLDLFLGLFLFGLIVDSAIVVFLMYEEGVLNKTEVLSSLVLEFADELSDILFWLQFFSELEEWQVWSLGVLIFVAPTFIFLKTWASHCKARDWFAEDQFGTRCDFIIPGFRALLAAFCYELKLTVFTKITKMIKIQSPEEAEVIESDRERHYLLQLRTELVLETMPQLLIQTYIAFTAEQTILSILSIVLGFLDSCYLLYVLAFKRKNPNICVNPMDRMYRLVANPPSEEAGQPPIEGPDPAARRV